MIPARWIGTLALALAIARDARAAGGVLSTAREPATVVEARFAMAVSRAQTTRWASLRVERFPGAMAWLLPVRPGARVDEVTDAWFEALEVATAPRVVGPRCGVDAAAPDVHVERSTLHEPTASALHVTPVDDVDALRAFAKEWALELLPETATRFEALEARGFSFVALVYAGSADRTLTRTVRVTDDAFPAVPLFLTSGPTSRSAVRVAAFFIAESRMRVGADAEREVDPAAVFFSDAGATNYDGALVAELLARGGRSWFVEAADHAFLFDGVRGPLGAATSAPLVTTYLDRARAYGDSSDDPDLALSGLDPSSAWITRVAGIVPAREFGDDLAVTMAPNVTKSPFVVARAGRGCTPSVPDAGSGGPPVSMPPNGVDAGPPRIDPPPPPGTTTGSTTGSGTTGGGPIDPGDGTVSYPPVTTQGSFSCSCSGADDGSSSDSCARSESGDTSSSDDGCDGSPSGSSGDEGSDDGCDGSSSDASGDEGCDGDASGDDTSQDGCAGDSTGDSGDGCDTSESSSGSDPKCGVARQKRRGRSRTSAFVFALVAILLPLRRLTRPRT